MAHILRQDAGALPLQTFLILNPCSDAQSCILFIPVQIINAGAVPDRKMASVLVSTRLTEVRGFSDFFSEFYQVLSYADWEQERQDWVKEEGRLDRCLELGNHLVPACSCQAIL